jgi:site-specific recombinase XerD
VRMTIHYLQRKGKSLRYRRRVRQDLRPYFGGRREITRALGLSVGEEHKALGPIRRIDAEVSCLFREAERALVRKDDPETLAAIAEQWALHEKYIGIDRAGLGSGAEREHTPFDQWVDELMREADRRAPPGEEPGPEHLDPLDQTKLETVQRGKRVQVPLSIERAIETFAEFERDNGLTKPDKTAFNQFRSWLPKHHSGLLKDITRANAREYLQYLASSGTRTADTIKRQTSPLVTLWSKSIEHYELDGVTNPWANLEMPKNAKRSRRANAKRLAFNRDHWRIIDTYLACNEGDIRDALVLIKFTGCRPLEIGGLFANDILEIDGVTCIRVEFNENRRVKNDASERIVPVVAADALEVLLRRSKAGGALFPKSMHGTDNLSHRTNYALRKAGLPKSERLTTYTLRHSIIEALRVSNAPLHHVKAVAGHSDGSITELYGAGGVDMRELAKSLNAAYERLGDVPMHVYEEHELVRRESD